jgi:AGCS family alanine or glycine:cation symporter
VRPLLLGATTGRDSESAEEGRMIDTLNDWLGQLLVVVLIPLGFYFTVRSRGVQFRYLGRMFRVLRGAFHHQAGHISSFQALALSVAGRVGAGNVAGVAVAITLGGPGAIFWMWVVGLMGMATSFFECSLAQLYKQSEPDGSYRGGPAYYIQRGLKKRWLAALFSVLLFVTFGFGFPAVQSFTMASSLEDAFGVPTLATGCGIVVVVGLVIFGGIKRIAQVAELVVPFMAIGYFAMTLVVIGLNVGEIPAVFTLIVKSAFGLEPAIGGGLGAALMYGVRRGLFSNEAGLGSAPNVAAVAYVRHPADQGVVQSLSVFVDTIIMCSCTAMIILMSDLYQPGTDVGGVTLTQLALAEHVGEWGRSFVSVALLLFTFTTIIYNYYLGENALNFFSEENRTLFTIYRVFMLALVFWGTFQDLGSVFAFADITMSLLAVVNLTALVLLAKTGMRLLADYDAKLSTGNKEPMLQRQDFDDLDLDDRAWGDEAR